MFNTQLHKDEAHNQHVDSGSRTRRTFSIISRSGKSPIVEFGRVTRDVVFSFVLALFTITDVDKHKFRKCCMRQDAFQSFRLLLAFYFVVEFNTEK